MYETVLAPYILIPTTLALISPKHGKFNVTPKSHGSDESCFAWRAALPVILLLVLNVAGITVGGLRLMTEPERQAALLMNMFWALLNVMILGASVAVAAERRQRRHEARLERRYPARLILQDGRVLAGETDDMSNSGVALTLDEPAEIADGAFLTLLVTASEEEVALPVEIVGTKDREVRIRFSELEVQQRDAVARMIFAGADLWLTGLDFGSLMKFTEGFATSFRRRNVATSGGDPLFVAAQATPGYPYFTETGFYNDSFPAENGMNLLGLAETGTRLNVVFDHIPTGVQLWASVTEVAGSTGYDATAPKAMLTYTSEATYGGAFSVESAWVPGYAQPYLNGTTTNATWEVVSADPSVVESLLFSIALTAQGGTPITGTASMTATIAPLAIARTDGTIPLPSFLVPVAATTATSTTTTTTATTTAAATTSVPAFSIVNSIPNVKTGMYSAASFSTTVAPASLAAVTVPGLLATAAISTVSIVMVDSIGAQRTCQVVSISLQQAICLVDAAIKPGLAVVSVASSGRPAGTGFVQVAQVAPGLFSADSTGQGLAAGSAISQVGDATFTSPLAVLDTTTNTWIAQPIDLSAAPGGVTLELRATGLRGRNANGYVVAQIAGLDVPFISITASTTDVGVDLVQIGPLPQSLAGSGLVDVLLAVDGVSANPVSIYID